MQELSYEMLGHNQLSQQVATPCCSKIILSATFTGPGLLLLGGLYRTNINSSKLKFVWGDFVGIRKC